MQNKWQNGSFEKVRKIYFAFNMNEEITLRKLSIKEKMQDCCCYCCFNFCGEIAYFFENFMKAIISLPLQKILGG